MSSPLDEDAPALARVAVQAVTVLNDATADSVDYPGLNGPRDIEAVLSALARLSDELQQTATHLDDYLSGQVREQGLKRAKGNSQTPACVVGTIAGGLAEVRAAAEHISTLLTAAELAMLAVDPSDQR